MKRYIILVGIILLILFYQAYLYSAQSANYFKTVNSTRFTFGDNGADKGFALTRHNASHWADNQPITNKQSDIENTFSQYIIIHYFGNLITTSFSYTENSVPKTWTALILKAKNLSDTSSFWTDNDTGETNVLYIDPALGRFRIITSQDFNAGNLYTVFYYDTIPPANPAFKDLPQEFIADTPYLLHGTKEPYSSVWLSLNNGTWEEVVPVNDQDVWSYDIYFSEGNNIVKIYSLDMTANQSEIVESIPINYFAYLSKDVNIVDADKGWFTFGIRNIETPNDQLGHRLTKNDLAKTPLGLNQSQMNQDIIDAYNNNWLKVKFENEDIITRYSMTYKYIYLSVWDNPDPAVGNNELGIDPVNGRFIIGPGQALNEIKPEAFNLSTIHFYDPIPPSAPLITNIPEDLTEFTTDCPFKVQGTKTPYSSVWLRLNKTGDYNEVTPVDSILEWAYDTGMYLLNGENFIEVYSKDFCDNIGDISTNIIYYRIIKPTLEKTFIQSDECVITLNGTKGKNSEIQYTRDLAESFRTIIANNENTSWDHLFYLKKGTNIFYIRTVDLAGNQSDPVMAQVVYQYQDPELEVYSPTTSSTQWVIGEIGNRTPIDDNHIKITCDNEATVGSVIPYYDDNHFVCKLSGLNTPGTTYQVTLYTIDEATNQSATINKDIIYDPSSVGEETLQYQWNKNNLNISWDPAVGASQYQVYLSRNRDETDVETLSLYTPTSLLTLDYNNKLDSPYLFFHIKPDSSTNITHKKINAQQLTTLTPYFEDFIRTGVLNKGTFYTVQDWSVDEPAHALQNISSIGTSMIHIPQVSPTWSSYEYEIRLKKETGANTDISLLYKVKSQDKFYEFNIQDNQIAHKYNSQNISKVLTESVNFDEYRKIKLIVKYNRASGNTYVKSFIEDDSQNYVLKNYFVYPIFPYGGIGLMVKDCSVSVDYIKITPLN